MQPTADGSPPVVVFGFDTSKYVPHTKDPEARRRARPAGPSATGSGAAPVAQEMVTEVSDHPLPYPWMPALSTPGLKSKLSRYVHAALASNFERLAGISGCPAFVLALHGAGQDQERPDAPLVLAWDGKAVTRRDQITPEFAVGEADLLYSFWSRIFPDRRCLWRTLDSDAIVSLLLEPEGHLRDTTLWLVLGGSAPPGELFDEIFPRERRVVVTQRALLAGVTSPWVMSLLLITLGTDFVESKCVKQMSERDFVRLGLEVAGEHDQVVTEASAMMQVDEPGATQLLQHIINLRGKGKMDANTPVLLRRSVWNLLYWRQSFTRAGFTPSPLERADGLSVFGWETAQTGEVVAATQVTERVPSGLR